MAILTRQQEKKLDNLFFQEASGSVPEEWEQPLRFVWERYRGTQTADAMIRRYRLKEKPEAICQALGISSSKYFCCWRDFLLMAALEGIRAKLEI